MRDKLDMQSLDDIGNSKRFAAMHGRRLRFGEDAADCLAKDGDEWGPAPAGEALRAAIETADAMEAAAAAWLAYAKRLADRADGPDALKDLAEAEKARDRGEALAAWAAKSRTVGKLKAMLTLAAALLPRP